MVLEGIAKAWMTERTAVGIVDTCHIRRIFLIFLSFLKFAVSVDVKYPCSMAVICRDGLRSHFTRLLVTIH